MYSHLLFYWQISTGFDVKEIVFDKIRANAEKYPVEKAKGNAKKILMSYE